MTAWKDNGELVDPDRSFGLGESSLYQDLSEQSLMFMAKICRRDKEPNEKVLLEPEAFFKDDSSEEKSLCIHHALSPLLTEFQEENTFSNGISLLSRSLVESVVSPANISRSEDPALGLVMPLDA